MSKKLKICVYAICRDEANFVDRFMDSIKEADGVFVLDTGSKDDTVEKLRARGAVVQVLEYSKWSTLEEYDKLLAEGKRPWRFDEPRNISMEMVPTDTDVCVCIDLDEVMTPGWRDVIENNWKENFTSMRYMYEWSREKTFRYNKITARHGYIWRTPIHETIYPIVPENEVIGWRDEVLVKHFPDPNKSRGQYLHLLQLAVREEPTCARSSYYYGRELTYHNKWEESIKQLQAYMKLESWSFERAEACIMIANAYNKLGKKLEQEQWLLRACSEDSKQREPWVELADFYRLEKRHLLSYSAAKHALTINHLPASHLNRMDCWGAKPFDIASLGAFYAGMRDESYDLAVEALMRSPWDERLIKNCHLIQDVRMPRLIQKTYGVNVIILSYAKTDTELLMTERCIKSLVQSSPGVPLNIIVVETNPRTTKYPNPYMSQNVHIETVFPCEPFGYNRFLGYGWEKRNPSVGHTLIMNNDITVFSKDFVRSMMEGIRKHSLDSASPVGIREQFFRKQDLGVEVYEGYNTNSEINGWCIMFHHCILESVPFQKYFPPALKFYYQDNWYGRMLEKNGFRHGVLTGPKALHLQQQSHSLVSEAEHNELTTEQKKVFEELWEKENAAQ